MDVLMDGLLTAATLFAGAYCWVLSRRVRDLKSLDRGLGGAIVTLTRQVELARTTLEEAQVEARSRKAELGQLIERADSAAATLKLTLAGTRGSAAAPERSDRPAPASRAPAARDGAGRPDLPKPRRLPPIGNPLRNREPIAAPRSEDELMDALSALAAGGAG